MPRRALVPVIVLSTCALGCAQKGTGDVGASPAEVVFEPAYPGVSQTAEVRLTNGGSAAATVQLSAAAPFSVIEAAVLVPPRGEAAARVAFTPSASGRFDGALAVRANAGSMEVRLVGTGLEPPSCGPPSFDCTVQVFDPAGGTCVSRPAEDGIACQTACIPLGGCLGGACVGQVKAACDDGDACTIDACDAGFCAEVKPKIACPPARHACEQSHCDSVLGCLLIPRASTVACGPDFGDTWHACWAGACLEQSSPTPNAEIPDCGGSTSSEHLCVDGWCWEHPLPGPRMNAVWGSGPDDVWFVGEDALHWNGQRFARYEVAPSQLFDVHGAGPTNVWAVGQQRTIRRLDSADGGTRWVPVSAPAGMWQEVTTVWRDATGQGWIASSQGSAPFRWNGSGWVTGGGSDATSRIWGSGPNDVYFASLNGWIRHWNGSFLSSGEQLGQGAVGEVFGVGGRIYALAWGGVLVRTSGGWKVERTLNGEGTGLFATSAQDVWVTRYSGKPLRYDGAGWFEMPEGPDPESFGVQSGRKLWASGRNDAWMLSHELDDFGRDHIRHWDGRNWKRVTCRETSSTINQIHASDPSNVWAVSDDVVLQRTPSTWVAHSLPQGVGSPRAVWSSGPSDVWVGTNVGDLVRWDGGEWTKWATGNSAQITSIWGSGPNDVWAVGGNFSALVLHFDGVSWSSRAPPPLSVNVVLNGVWGTSANNVYVATSGGLYRWDGTAWTVALTTAWTFRSVHGTSATDVWVVGDEGIRHWDGIAWRSEPAGILWDPLRVFAAAPNDVWVASFSGQVARFQGTWTTPPIPVPLSTVGGAGASVWLGGSSGYIVRPAP